MLEVLLQPAPAGAGLEVFLALARGGVVRKFFLVDQSERAATAVGRGAAGVVFADASREVACDAGVVLAVAAAQNIDPAGHPRFRRQKKRPPPEGRGLIASVGRGEWAQIELFFSGVLMLQYQRRSGLLRETKSDSLQAGAV